VGRVGRCGSGLGVRNKGYPGRLLDLERPPDRVYLVGPWDHPGPHVAIVGARNATEDGIDVARDLAGSLAERGVAVVSGLARGIDAAAHEGALGSGGASGAVLGTSLDETYPREHAELQERVARSLGLMSEIAPGTPATRGTFATRNRLLAAIADVVVVVQGGARSGSLITAAEAKRLGRLVGAIPWDCREPLGEAPHALIRSGAGMLVRSADDVMELLAGDAGDASAAPNSVGDAQAPRSGGRERSGSGATGPGARSVFTLCRVRSGAHRQHRPRYEQVNRRGDRCRSPQAERGDQHEPRCRDAENGAGRIDRVERGNRRAELTLPAREGRDQERERRSHGDRGKQQRREEDEEADEEKREPASAHRAVEAREQGPRHEVGERA